MKKKKNNISLFISIVTVIFVCMIGLFLLKTYEPAVTSTNAEIDYSKQPSMGEEDALVNVTEFADFKCPACAYWKQSVLPQLKKDFIDTGKVKFHFMNYPFLGEDSYTAASMGELIFDQYGDESFWKYADIIYSNQGSEHSDWASSDKLVKLIEKYNLDMDTTTIQKEFSQEKYTTEVSTDKSFGKSIGVNSTPTIYINGSKVKDPFNYEKIKEHINTLIEDK